ncbi:tryptophan 2,3-dioxygenase isoform X2 [Adelges cooleyi]|uniref:tryptophan 2,3-dioxygenase isoform X2 n=1 Tax=Adelges cooleyi TaxID=133065 RepID=UPI00218011DE|nr:tryptophan 2,3-dioxygenase isoform X2 [Adelges cooleyi]
MSYVNGNERIIIDRQNKKCKINEARSYTEYLKLDRLLSSQIMLSPQRNIVTYDEHLFIITHQAFELWFKQILFEIDLIRKSFTINLWVKEPEMFNVFKRIGRITTIFKLLLEHFSVLESMHPCDFAEFRDLLTPASGFQSLQFRLIENKLGLKTETRVCCSQSYPECFDETQRLEFERTAAEPTLFMLVGHWLECTPDLLDDAVWERYRKAADRWLQDSKKIGITRLEKRRQILSTVFDSDQHKALVEQGHRILSHKALKGAILIYSYRQENGYGLANRILESLVDLDTILSKWRCNYIF